MGKSKISWCDYTWSPVTGCTPCGPGCQNCWANAIAPRLEGDFEVTLRRERLEEPLRWTKPRRIFVVPRGDLFHPHVPFKFQCKVLDVMRQATHHVFFVLTKRPKLMELVVRDYMVGHRCEIDLAKDFRHVWWGISVENKDKWFERVPALIALEDINRYISFEPLLEDIPLMPEGWLPYLHWFIVGGESGPKHRPMRIDWVRQIRDVALDRNIPFFFKQRSNLYPERGKELDGREWEQYPFAWPGVESPPEDQSSLFE